MGEDGPLWVLIIITLLILIQAIISAVRSALNNVNETSVRRKSENGDKKSTLLFRILKSPDNYIHALELILTLVCILIGIIYCSYFLPGIEALILKSDIKADIRIIKPFYHILFTVLLVFFHTLFGIILPAKYAKKHSEAFAYKVIGFVRLIGMLLKPITWLIMKFIKIIAKISGVKPLERTDGLTEDEIISMVNEGHEQGVFDAGEAEMISNIIELDDKEAEDIMTHKKRIVAVDSAMTVEAALYFMLSEAYSRYPLYEDNRDNMIGVLHLKDVINAYLSKELRIKPLKEIAREPYFVPSTQKINILFHDMQQKNIHMAIVIDEYGQTAGLVAMEDFLEEIVGNIQDEYDKDENMVVAVEDGSYVVKGTISLETLEDELGILIEHEDYDTLNGLLISILDRIPLDGEKAVLEYQGYRFDILEAMNKMIQMVRISRLKKETLVINKGSKHEYVV